MQPHSHAGLFDVHAHLTDPRLAAIETQVLANAKAANITTIISNGLNPTDNQRVLDLAARTDIVKPAIGLYPVDAVLPEMEAAGVEYHRDGTEELPSGEEAVQWVRDHLDEAVAVGEIGLDGYWVPKNLWDRQEQLFRSLVKLAMDADKPIIVHSRKREAHMFEVLKDMGANKVNWHCYSSKVKLGLRIGNHPGQYLSIPANARRSEGFRALLTNLPRDRVLLETDCPYLAPERGTLNEPKNVLGTVTLAAELWHCTEQEVVQQLRANFTELFGFEP